MISNWLFIVLIILLSMVAYFIGLRRGITGSQHLYDDGWLAAEEYFKRFPELVEGDADKSQIDYYEVFNEGRDAALDFVREMYVLVPKDADRTIAEYRRENMEELCNQLEDLFEDEDEDNKIDGGEY